MDARTQTKPLPVKTVLLFSMILLFFTVSCRKQEAADPFCGYYANSSKDHLLRAVELTRADGRCAAVLHYSDRTESYRAVFDENEIVLSLGGGDEWRMFLNGAELRGYEVKKSAYQPEDMEWTFYKAEK